MFSSEVKTDAGLNYKRALRKRRIKRQSDMLNLGTSGAESDSSEALFELP